MPLLRLKFYKKKPKRLELFDKFTSTRRNQRTKKIYHTPFVKNNELQFSFHLLRDLTLDLELNMRLSCPESEEKDNFKFPGPISIVSSFGLSIVDTDILLLFPESL